MIVKMDHSERGWREGSSCAAKSLGIIFLNLENPLSKNSKFTKIHVLKIIVKNSNNFLLHDNIITPTTLLTFLISHQILCSRISFLMTMRFNFRVREEAKLTHFL